MKLRDIAYTRHEYNHPPEPREGNLLWLVHDIPYFDACGIFPPFHIVNEIFLSGGGDGGMGPGTSWVPFSISNEEYAVLLDAVLSTPKSEIVPYARYAMSPKELDPAFDHIPNRMSWLAAVCKKHKASYHEKLRKLASLK